MKIHHIGYVVKDIDIYLDNLVLDNVIKRVYDDTQKAELVLVRADNTLIELIEPSSKKSFTYNFLMKGGGYHHLCYEINCKNKVKEIIKTKKMIIVLDWVYAPLLGTEVIFAYNKNKEIVEFTLC